MLRILRIIGIVIFALLVGLSADSLRRMYETGQLMERYNSSRKSSLTLFSVSVLALSSLAYFELSRGRRQQLRRGYGAVRDSQNDDEDIVEGLDSTSIYAAPKTRDAWKGRRSGGSKSRSREQKDSANVWMGLLRICCAVFPLYFAGMLVVHIMKMDPQQELAWLLPSLFLSLTLFSVLTAFGVLAKKPWGLTLGYILAIVNLLVFPIGTAIGLFLLMGLVGSTPLFVVSARDKRRNARRKSSGKSRAAVI